MNLPGVPIPIPSLTRKDMDDLEFALELGVDFVALSFVRSAADVRDLRALIEHAGSPRPRDREDREVRGGGLLEAILDGVGRGHGRARRPRRRDRAGARAAVQKRIILRGLERGKPVITATQMLESMIHQAEPTRAEASDVANAILDGTLRA